MHKTIATSKTKTRPQLERGRTVRFTVRTIRRGACLKLVSIINEKNPQELRGDRYYHVTQNVAK